MGIGQHEFGFFSRSTGFEPLRAEAPRLELRVGGAIGERWPRASMGMGMGIWLAPGPGFSNYTLDLQPDSPPAKITLLRPIVRIAGPWQIRFTLPALT